MRKLTGFRWSILQKGDRMQSGFIKRIIKLLVSNFFEHDVGKNAAALAYYLLFAIFPLLIFLSNLRGLLNSMKWLK